MTETDAMPGAWRKVDEVPEGFCKVMGDVIARAVPGGAEAKIAGGPERCNVFGGLHGGFLAAFAEQCLFLPLYLHGRVPRNGVVTIAFDLQYVAQADALREIGASVELVRETGRLAFVRGTVHQDGVTAVVFSATLRKVRAEARA